MATAKRSRIDEDMLDIMVFVHKSLKSDHSHDDISEYVRRNWDIAFSKEAVVPSHEEELEFFHEKCTTRKNNFIL